MPISYFYEPALTAESFEPVTAAAEPSSFFAAETLEANLRTPETPATSEVLTTIHRIMDNLADAPIALAAALDSVRSRIRSIAAETPASTPQEAVKPVEEPALVAPRSQSSLRGTTPYIIEQTLESMWDANRTADSTVYTTAQQNELQTYAARLETVSVPRLGVVECIAGWWDRLIHRSDEPAWARTFITEQPASGRYIRPSGTQWALDQDRIHQLSDAELQKHFTVAEQYVARAHQKQLRHRIPTQPVGLWEQKIYSALTREMIRRTA